MKSFIKIAIILLIIVFSLLLLIPTTRAGINSWVFGLKEVDEATLYENSVKVEDTARAMISNYTADSLIYEQYKDSTNSDEKSWANSAKTRANKTASTYNNYLLKNSHVWKENMPKDILAELQYLK